jgi:hypothetical protein
VSDASSHPEQNSEVVKPPASKGLTDPQAQQDDHARKKSPPSRRLRSLVSDLGLKDLFASLLAVVGTVAALVPFLDLRGYADIIVVTVDVLAILMISLILPGKTLRLPLVRIAMVALLAITAVAVPVGAKVFFAVKEPSPVQVIHFDPFDYNGEPLKTLTIQKEDGQCWTTSISDPRINAWRCMSSSGIYDPCFSSTAYDFMVICAGEPWDTNVIELNISKLPKEMNGASPIGAYPWAIELSSSVRCSFPSGTTGSGIEGRLNYFCDDGISEVFNLNLDQGTAEVGEQGVSTVSKENVIFAWY